jgi:hypothetical protein
MPPLVSTSQSKLAHSTSSSAGPGQSSWQRTYKRQLVDNEDQWLDTCTKKEEDAVIASTIEAIKSAHNDSQGDCSLPDHLGDVSRFDRFLVGSLRTRHTITRKFGHGLPTTLAIGDLALKKRS